MDDTEDNIETLANDLESLYDLHKVADIESKKEVWKDLIEFEIRQFASAIWREARASQDANYYEKRLSEDAKELNEYLKANPSTWFD